MRSPFFIAAMLAAVSAAHPALAAYDFATISDPSGTLETAANGINDAGVVVGDYTDASGTHGFTDTGGLFATIDGPGAASTSARGINNSNEIVGSYIDGLGAAHGFTAVGGTVTPFDVPFPGTSGATYGTGISNAGAMVGAGSTVGYFFDSSSVAHGFVNSGGYSQLDVTAASATVATGINAAGTIVGYYVDASGATHGFVHPAGGGYSSIDDPSGTNGTFVTGINDLGEITGYYVDASNVTHGFVLIGADFVTVDAPDSLAFTEVNGVNNLGEIVGEDINAATGQIEGFAATVPEPATLSTLGFAALALLKGRRRRTI